MKREFVSIFLTGAAACLLPIAFGIASAQSAEAPGGPRFDVADVHPSPSSASGNQYMRGGFYRGGRYEVRTASMVDLISTAWGVESTKVTGGPAWLDKDRFDIIAKAPPTTDAETLRAMLRNLLTERFSLKVHNDSKPLPAYALTQGKKLQLKPGDDSGDTGCKLQPQPEPPPGSGGGRMMTMNASGVVSTFSMGVPLVYSCHNVSMASLATLLPTMQFVPGYLNGNHVVDETELKGNWNFELKYSIQIRQLIRPNQDNAPSIITIFDAVDKQLGLKLDLTKVPTPVTAVDSANETPTPNPPGVIETAMPAMPTEFEVADIKPSDPNPPPGPRFNRLFEPGGRVNLTFNTLQNLISTAWNVNANLIEGGPKFITKDQWDVVAKASTAKSLSNLNNGDPAPDFVDYDSMRVMLQALLKDRFKLALHEETRDLPGYALVVVKSKLKKADPSNREGCTEGPGPDGKDPRTANPDATRLFSCLNMTMADFAKELPDRAGGYFGQFPGGVVDATNLEGAYDFTVNFSPAGRVGGGGGGGRSGDGPAPAVGTADDPGGAISLQEAIEKQLGLKLEPRKNPGKVVVIDHVEQKPTEN